MGNHLAVLNGLVSIASGNRKVLYEGIAIGHFLHNKTKECKHLYPI